MLQKRLLLTFTSVKKPHNGRARIRLGFLTWFIKTKFIQPASTSSWLSLRTLSAMIFCLRQKLRFMIYAFHRGSTKSFVSSFLLFSWIRSERGRNASRLSSERYKCRNRVVWPVPPTTNVPSQVKNDASSRETRDMPAAQTPAWDPDDVTTHVFVLARHLHPHFSYIIPSSSIISHSSRVSAADGWSWIKIWFGQDEKRIAHSASSRPTFESNGTTRVLGIGDCLCGDCVLRLRLWKRIESYVKTSSVIPPLRSEMELMNTSSGSPSHLRHDQIY